LALFTLVNASGKKPQMRSHKWLQMFAEVQPNFSRLVALPSRTFGQILRRNFANCRTSAHLYSKYMIICDRLFTVHMTGQIFPTFGSLVQWCWVIWYHLQFLTFIIIS